jgi:hypothetical protein
MKPGDKVIWVNKSYFHETRGGGEIVHIHSDWAVILNLRTAQSHPHIDPFVVKHLWELQLDDTDA